MEPRRGAGAHSRRDHSGFVYRERIDLRAFVSCALSFSVGSSLRIPILAGGIFLRSRLRHPRGHTRGRWFILAAEQALEESHLDTSISPILAWRRPNSHRPLCIPFLHAAASVRLGGAGVSGAVHARGSRTWVYDGTNGAKQHRLLRSSL